MHNNTLEPYFPLSFRWLGYFIVPFGIFRIFMAQGLWGVAWPALAIVAGVAFIWTFYGSQIDFEKKQVMDYVGLFGMKLGKWSRLPELERIFITKSNYSQVIWSRIASTKQRSTVFRAYLKGPDDFKFLFSERRKKDLILAEVKTVSEELDLQVLDCTVKPPVWLDSDHPV